MYKSTTYRAAPRVVSQRVKARVCPPSKIKLNKNEVDYNIILWRGFGVLGHITAVGNLQRHVRILFNQQNSRAC